MAEGRLAEGGVAEGRLAEGRLGEGRLAEGGVAEGRLAEGGLAEGRLAEGRLAESRLAEGALFNATLRYLGHQGQALTPDLADRIDRMIARCKEVARPKSTAQACHPSALNLSGADIARHLADAVEVVLMAVTLGHGVDRELRRLSLTDPLGQVLFDAAATALVEYHADAIEADIRARAHGRGLYCSWRFSPGYGDLPLDVQPGLLTRLDANRRLGITLTQTNLMVPTKSVTALVGLHPTPQPGPASTCSACTLRPHCRLRSRGLTCRR